MSSPFNYELNEHRIKILMQDAELESGKEELWNKFESIESIIDKKSPSVKTTSYKPRFNLRISDSVILPILLIILIAGLSALLFSFVDFKKKKNPEKEIPLVANPENFKRTEKTSTKVMTPKETIATPLKTVEAVVPAINITDTNSVTVKETKPATAAKTIKVEPKESIITTVKTKKETVPIIVKNKSKNKKIKTEQLPIIKAINDLNKNTNEAELELDLK